MQSPFPLPTDSGVHPVGVPMQVKAVLAMLHLILHLRLSSLVLGAKRRNRASPAPVIYNFVIYIYLFI